MQKILSLIIKYESLLNMSDSRNYLTERYRETLINFTKDSDMNRCNLFLLLILDIILIRYKIYI